MNTINIKTIFRAELVRRSLYEFVKYFWDVIIADEFKDNWHIKVLCDEVQLVYERVFLRQNKEYDLLINIPPNTSKSTIVSVMAPVWGWTRDPSIRYITGSNTIDLATDHAAKSRDIFKSWKFKELFPEIELKADRDSKRNYETTANGSRAVCAVSSSIIGKHAHLINIDDPIDPKGSRSDVEIGSAVKWVTSDLRTRKIDQNLTPTILIMQRLAEDDPSGVWLETKKDLRHICLPAEVSELDNIHPPELKDRYINGLLDPVRLPLRVLSESKREMGSSEFAGQYLQSPKAFDGNIVKREWFNYYDNLPTHEGLKLIVHSWDTAFKAKENNDFSCCTVWYVYNCGYYLYDIYKEKVESPELKRQIIHMDDRDKPDYVLIEDKASGIVMIQQLQAETTINIVPVQVHTDKTARLRDASPTIEGGNIFIPRGKEFSTSIVDNLCIFPNGKHDDDVDSVTQFINWIKINYNSRNEKIESLHKKRESIKHLERF